MNMARLNKQKQRILVFGAEKKGISAPSEKIQLSDYEITFDTFEDSKPFDHFDGVILFQGLFEEERTHRDQWGKSTKYRIENSKELDRRNNEISLLMKKQGFICIILCQEFYEPYGKFKYTDCAKYWLNGARIDREDFGGSTGLLEAVRSEFKNFFDRYGRAFSSLKPAYNCHVDRIELARFGSDTVGFIISDNFFFVPARMPKQSEVEIYFKELSKAIISTRKKLVYSIPEWVHNHRFLQEMMFIRRKEKAEKVLENIEERLRIFKRYKRVLIASGELLVNEVLNILQTGLGFKAKSNDEFKEDIQIFDDEGKIHILIEVKGVNTGVKRDYVYQAESHRERANVSNDFPSVLIINTHCKRAGSVDEEDIEVEDEQIQLANNLRILILRTLDLLRLLELYMNSEINQAEILRLLTTQKGWLHLFPDLHYEIKTS